MTSNPAVVQEEQTAAAQRPQLADLRSNPKEAPQQEHAVGAGATTSSFALLPLKINGDALDLDDGKKRDKNPPVLPAATAVFAVVAAIGTAAAAPAPLAPVATFGATIAAEKDLDPSGEARLAAADDGSPAGCSASTLQE